MWRCITSARPYQRRHCRLLPRAADARCRRHVHFGDATPQLIDYSGGGSAKEWTKTLDGALQLDFDTVVPGMG